ncbi:MAG: HK97 gp10 family phage protein [Eubacteriales bacterium]|nr:HK97 gp10 family phage protein [Eubacteriales bacterium]
MALDYSGMKNLAKNMNNVEKQYDSFLRHFLLLMGLRVIAQTKKLTPVRTGNLRNRWELSEVFKQGDSLVIVIYNPVEYASFVEDGHMQYRRWVPGTWQGDQFMYQAGSKEGMMLRTKFVPGVHMARISITKIENEIPQRYQRALNKFLKDMGVA